MSRLHVHAWGPAGAPPVVLLHGFMGTGADWAPVAERLPGRRVLAPDLPGHGRSIGLPDADYTLHGVAAAIADLLGPNGLLGGYSMGGRLALETAVATRGTGTVRAMALISAHPGIAREEDRTARLALDMDRARALEQDFPDLLDRWLEMPLFAGLAPPDRARLRSERMDRCRPEELAQALTGFSSGRQARRLDRVEAVVQPIVGEADARYLALWQEAAGGRIASPCILSGAGHNLLAERPGELAEALDLWLSAEGGR